MELNDIRRLMSPVYPVNKTIGLVASVLIPLGMQLPPVIPTETLTISRMPSPYPPGFKLHILRIARRWFGFGFARWLKIARWESAYECTHIRNMSFKSRPVDAIFLETLSPVRKHWWELWLPKTQSTDVQLVIYDHGIDTYYDGGFIARGATLAMVFPDTMPTFLD